MHLKSYRASFVSYKTSIYSAVSSLSSGFVPPNFLTPDQLAAIAEDLTAEEIRRGTKLTPAIQVGFEATYYEVQIVLEVTVLQEGLSIVLGIPMNSKSSTFDVYRAIPLHQANEDGTTASVYRFSHEFVAIATGNSQYAELSATTLNQCSGTNRIKLCRKGSSTTTDETLLCLTSPFYEYSIPAHRNCLVHSVLLPEAPQASYLADGLYHVISRTARFRSKTTPMVYLYLYPHSSVKPVLFDPVVRPHSPSIMGILFLPRTWTFMKPDPSRSLHLSNLHLLWLQSLIPYLVPASI